MMARTPSAIVPSVLVRGRGKMCTELAIQLALQHGRDPMIRWAQGVTSVIRRTPWSAPADEAEGFLEDAVWYLTRGSRPPDMEEAD